MKFTAPKPFKAPQIPTPKKTPQIAAKLGKMLGGVARAKAQANAPDSRYVALPRPDKAVGNAAKSGYQGRQPVLGSLM